MRYKYRFILLCILVTVLSLAACNKLSDSQLRELQEDSLEVARLHDLSMRCKDVDSAIMLVIREQQFEHQNKFYYEELDSWNRLFDLYVSTGDIMKAFKAADRASRIADSINYPLGLARCFHNLAKISSKMNNYSIANKNYNMALRIYNQYNDEHKIADLFRDLARSSYNFCFFDSAEVQVMYAYRLDTKHGNKLGVKTDLVFRGEMNLTKCRKNPSKYGLDVANEALTDFVKASQMELDTVDTEIDDIIVSGMCELYAFLSSDDKLSASDKRNLMNNCMSLYNKALEIVRKSGDIERVNHFIMIRLNYLLENGKINEATQIADSVYNLALKDTVTFENHELAMFAYALICNNKGEYKKAVEYGRKGFLYHESNVSANKGFLMTMALARGQHESEVMKALGMAREYQAKTMIRNIMIIVSLVILVLLVVIVVIVFHHNVSYKKMNAVIKQQNGEIMTQSQKVRQRNLEITSSINYASRIQRAAMPSKPEMNKILGDNFVIYQPKNIVAGDFYWTSMLNGLRILVVADCTGHGVPGALLSMLGITCLEYTVRYFGTSKFTASSMLDMLRVTFKSTLNQTSFNSLSTVDSMDLGLMIFDPRNMKVQFAGANRPMLLIRDNKILKLRGDFMPIGVHIREVLHFTNNEITVYPDDVIYMYSDGIADQFGYNSAEDLRSQTFSIRKLEKLFLEIHQKNFAEQKKIIIDMIDEWRKPKAKHHTYCAQTDDIVLVGVKIQNMLPQ
ncbi:MAG: SpoIIE family protein phosphatase [Bacteroidales bacterium]|nr:SpoIIE family protein phosphatase [Bacteroidales bacterium]